MNTPAKVNGTGQMQVPSFGLVPATMSEAMQLAEMMAGAKLVPKDLQKSPADCLMVIQQAVRWQMDPFAVAQECSVIQGKLMHSGKLVAAVINARGNLAERLSFAYEGDGDGRTITVTGRYPGETGRRDVRVCIKDAKTNNRMWQIQPDQQLMYHGSRVWARRHAPELMLGVYSPEEFDEAATKDAPPKQINEAAAPKDTAPNGSPKQYIEPFSGALTLVDNDGVVQEERIDVAEETEAERLARFDGELESAAKNGTVALKGAWGMIPPNDRAALKAALDRRHKPSAAAADKEAV